MQPAEQIVCESGTKIVSNPTMVLSPLVGEVRMHCNNVSGLRHLDQEHSQKDHGAGAKDSLHSVQNAWLSYNPFYHENHHICVDWPLGIERERKPRSKLVCLYLLEFRSLRRSFLGSHIIEP